MTPNSKLNQNEDEYFARESAELVRRQREELDAQRRATERKAHYMKCPKCGSDLTERTFHHMKIDECGECGGTWLDKGELQMIMHVKRNEIGRFLGRMLGLGDK